MPKLHLAQLLNIEPQEKRALHQSLLSLGKDILKGEAVRMDIGSIRAGTTFVAAFTRRFGDRTRKWPHRCVALAAPSDGYVKVHNKRFSIYSTVFIFIL
jgi:hypothetical protein